VYDFVQGTHVDVISVVTHWNMYMGGGGIITFIWVGGALETDDCTREHGCD